MKISCSSCKREIFDIETLPLDASDIIIVRGWDGDRSRLEKFSNMLRLAHFGALVVGLKVGETVEMISERQMMDLGWTRTKIAKRHKQKSGGGDEF